jgi:hypothetical protein
LRPANSAALLAAGALLIAGWWAFRSPGHGPSEPAENARATAVPAPAAPAPQADPSRTPAGSPAGEDTNAREIPTYFVTSEQDVIRVLEAHGLSQDAVARWAFAKGMDPAGFGITFGSQEAYTLYDDATLAALADQGDAWAQQTLADRIWKERPLEAADRYRDAASRGSAQAARQLANLYFYAADALDRGRTGDWSEETITALRQAGEADGGLEVSALAWSLAGDAEAGLPEGSFASFMLSDYTQDDVDAACRRAASIVADNADQRARLGLEPGWSGPAPLFPDPAELNPPGCPEGLLPAPDLSACEAVRLEMDGMDPAAGDRSGFTLRVCPNGG